MRVWRFLFGTPWRRNGNGWTRTMGLVHRVYGRLILMSHPNYPNFKQYLCRVWSGK